MNHGKAHCIAILHPKVDNKMFEESNNLWGTCNYIGAKVSRFLEGPEVPLGIFPHIRPTTPSSAAVTTTPANANTTTVDPNAAPCPSGSLTIPSDFTGTSGDVAAGQNAVYTCSDTTKVSLMPLVN